VWHNFIPTSKELCSKMALVEVGVSPRPCPSSSRLLKTFFKSHNFFIMEKWPVSQQLQVKVETLKFQQFYLMKFDFFQSFNFDLKLLWNWSFFHYEQIMRFKKVFSNLEPEGQGRGIIMGVTRLLILGPFSYITLFGGYKIMSHTVLWSCEY
jgi:hypothetical protein